MQIDIFQNLSQNPANYKTPVYWHELGSTYKNTRLSKLIEDEENSIDSSVEIPFFSQLVNTSKSKKQRFHRWIRYREGYAGDLVKEILNRHPIDKNSEYVLDPMCGSGSTNVACMDMGLDSLGLDVNPYAVMSTRVKTRRYDTDSIQKIEKEWLQIKSKFTDNHDINFNSFDLGIIKYFNERNLKGLVKIKNLLKQLKDDVLKDFFLLALLAIVEDCSNRKKDGNGLATRETSISSVINRFNEQVGIMLDDIINSTNFKPDTYTQCLSALDLDKSTFNGNGKSLGSIIFSPPYANSFDYVESYKLELVFGEYVLIDNLKSIRKNLIRSYRIASTKRFETQIETVALLCNEILEKIPQKELITGVRDGRTRLVPNMLCSYFEDMKCVLQKSYDSLNKNGKIHIVVDQSSYVGVPIPTDLIFTILGKEIGFSVENLIVCRKANTSGQQLKQFPYLKNLLRESIITLKKQ